MRKDKEGNSHQDQVREHVIRVVLEYTHEYSRQSAVISVIAAKISFGSDTLRKQVRQREIDIGLEVGTTTADWSLMKELECENLS